MKSGPWNLLFDTLFGESVYRSCVCMKFSCWTQRKRVEYIRNEVPLTRSLVSFFFECNNSAGWIGKCERERGDRSFGK